MATGSQAVECSNATLDRPCKRQWVGQQRLMGTGYAGRRQSMMALVPIALLVALLRVVGAGNGSADVLLPLRQ